MADRSKVLFILGTTRCGSTILENVLASVPGFVAAGEIHMLWRGIGRRFRCGCGEEIGSCPFWSEVLDRVQSPDDPDRVYRWQLSDVRIMHTPRLLRIDSWPETGRPELDRYADLLRRLYPEVGRDARVIVDSSKSPAAAAVLRGLDEVDLYVVHLVRDPRGVAYSWARGRPAGAGLHGPRDYRPGSVRSTGRWIATNLLGDAVRRRLPEDREMLLRYEDFVAHPRETVEALVRFVGEDPVDLPFVSDRMVQLEPNHCVSGNRSRFSKGDVQIRLDDEWRRAPGAWRPVVTALSAPWRSRYGYRREA